METKFRAFNPDQMGSAVRGVLASVGGVLATSGYVSEADWQMYSGVILALLPILWGIFSNRDAGLVQSALAVPKVEEIVVTDNAAITAVGTSGQSARKMSTAATRFRSHWIAALLAPLLLLAACNQTAGPGPAPAPSLVQTLVAALPDSIKTAIRDKCGWVEDQGVIANIVKAFILANAGVTANEVYNGVVNEICGTVKSHRRRGPAVVRGVKLQGHFVAR